ncbi:MAG: hypothetical protein VXV96_17595 [Bdellovibrionota bacterium]|jgi:hypothetical protein|nr:hypothetical protein [Bdellovibrionota bacterium]
MKKGCLRCKHYFSTFDPQKPRGCKLYGMKSHAFPSLIVKNETGSDCMGFQEKVKRKTEEKVNLNDPKYW